MIKICYKNEALLYNQKRFYLVLNFFIDVLEIINEFCIGIILDIKLEEELGLTNMTICSYNRHRYLDEIMLRRFYLSFHNEVLLNINTYVPDYIDYTSDRGMGYLAPIISDYDWIRHNIDDFGKKIQEYPKN